MLIRGIPVNMKLNNTVLMIASLVVSILAGFIFRFAETGRGINAFLFSAGMAYLKLLFLLAIPLVCLNLVAGVALRFRMRSGNAVPVRLRFFHYIAVVGAMALGIAAGNITGSSWFAPVPDGFSGFGLQLLRPLVPGALLLSALTGAAAGKAGSEGEEARCILFSMADVIGFAGALLLRLLPAGLFCLLCPLVAVRGAAVLWPAVKLVLVTAFCCAAYGVLVYGYQLRHCGKDCPQHFLRNFKPVLLQAFAACSSGNGEADAMRCLQRMGITENTGLAAWRCGTLLGKTGTILYCGIACLTAVHFRGGTLSLPAMAGIFIWILFVSLASAKYRGSGLYVVLVLLFVLGLPPRAAIPLLVFEWLLDGLRSALNSAAAGTGAYLADKLGWLK